MTEQDRTPADEAESGLADTSVDPHHLSSERPAEGDDDLPAPEPGSPKG